MPGIPHEAPIELLRRNPQLAAALLAGVGLAVPDGSTAMIASGDMTSILPTELRADAVVVIEGPAGKLAVVVEVQARLQHQCPAVLLIICRDVGTGRWARAPISCGPGAEVVPCVIDAETMPSLGSPGASSAMAEVAVLSAIVGAIDLDQEAGRVAALQAVVAAGLERDQLGTYTQLIKASASEKARKALEAMMATVYKDDFLDRFFAEGEAEGRARGEAEGRAKGEASMLLRMLAALGFEVPPETRERVLACTDLDQLGRWADRVPGAASLTEIFES